MQKSKVHQMTLLALLTALEIVLSRFCSINTWNLKIGFGFLPVAIAAMLFGPVSAAVAGGLSDFLGAVLFPIGPYFPGFTLTAVLTGVCFGIFLYKKTGFFKITVSVLLNEILGSLLLNSLWISILYSMPYKPLFISRLTTQVLPMIAIEIIVLWLIFGKSMIMENIKKAIEKQR